MNEKLLMQEENYINLLPKYEGYLQKLQINLEQLYHENQDFSNNFFEIRTEISLFKDELTNIMINNSLFSIETSKNEDSEIISNFLLYYLKFNKY